MSRAGDRDLKRMGERYAQFNDVDPDSIEEIEINALPAAGWVLGDLLEVHYRAAQFEGRPQTFRHVFKAHSRPRLVVTPDGQLLVLGGAYEVTDRGIVDS